MLKRFFLALSLVAGMLSPSFGAGVVPGFSLTPQYDLTGALAVGCKLYVYQAGTTATPQTAYQDSGLSIPSPGGNILSCDAAARLPQFFLADGSIKLVLRDSNGALIFSQDGLLVVGPSGGGGGGSSVDPTTILSTGDMKATYGTGVLTGFVRANGRTIGSATSGATERANSDTQGLFLFLCGVDVNLTISGGHGVSCTADWAANKALTLPDARGSALAGLDDMGNSTKGTFAAVSAFTRGNATTIGSLLGGATRTLLTANLPPYTPTGTNSAVTPLVGGSPAYGFSGPPSTAKAGTGSTDLTQSAGVGAFSAIQPNFSGFPQGGTSTPFDTVSPYLLLTFYIKL